MMNKIITAIFVAILAMAITSCGNKNKTSKEKDSEDKTEVVEKDDIVQLTPSFIESVHQFEELSSFSEGMAVVKKDGKRGFINTKGELAIPCQYDYVGSFSESWANVKKDDKWGFVNTNGELVIPCQYDGTGSFSGGMARVEQDDKEGFININGELIVQCEYRQVYSFSEGLAAVQKDGKWGFINTKGQLVIPCQYINAFDGFSEGLVPVDKKIEKSTYEYVFINTNGEVAISGQFDFAKSFSEGLAGVKKDGKWGFINTKGELIIPYQFDDFVHSFNEGLAIVKNNDKCGFINTKGELVVPCQYDNLYPMTKEGVALAIFNDESTGKKLYGYVDAKGNSTFTKSEIEKIMALQQDGTNKYDWLQGTWECEGTIDYGSLGGVKRFTAKAIISENIINVYYDGELAYSGSYDIEDGTIKFNRKNGYADVIPIDSDNKRLEFGDGKYYYKVSSDSDTPSNSYSSSYSDSSTYNSSFSNPNDVLSYLSGKTFRDANNQLRAVIDYDAIYLNGSATTGAPRISNITSNSATIRGQSPYMGGQDIVFYLNSTNGTLTLQSGEKLYLSR